MLNLFKLNTQTKKTKNKPISLEKDKDYYKDYPISTREWNNSIYVYNKNTLALIPQSTISAINLIKGYLNIYNLNLEQRMRKKRFLKRFRRLSSHKPYVSNGEFKHTNDKVIITLYTYNRQKLNYISLLEKRYLRIFDSVRKKKINNRFHLIKYKSLEYLKRADQDKFITIMRWKTYKVENKNIIDKYKSPFINDYLIKFYRKWVKKSLQKIKIYIYYRQLLYINESKYNYTNLQSLKKFIQKIYNKKVEFNLINLKYHYLNSDILSESLTLKITKNRKKLLKYLNRLIWKVKLSKTHKNNYFEPYLNKLNITDPLESLLGNKMRTQVESLKTTVLEEIKYKRLSGVRLEAAGRLTGRYTASRSVNKLRYIGNLANLDSSYYGLSTVILKGNLRSNLQYSKLVSKTRIGSFGIKVLVSGS